MSEPNATIREVDIPVYGTWCSRPAGETTADYQSAADTPGVVAIRHSEHYEFHFGAVADVTDADLQRLLESVTGDSSLRSLNLSGCRQLTSRALATLTSMPWLESLKLSGCDGVTDQVLAQVARITELQSLDLEGCERITNAGLAHLQTLTKLRDLSLHHCNIDDRGVNHLADLRELQSLSLDGCRTITDRGMEALARLPNLHRLGLIGCWQITNQGLEYLAGLPRLDWLGLCRSGSLPWRVLGRVVRSLGLPLNGGTPPGLFSASGVQRIQEAHPSCDIWQSIT